MIQASFHNYAVFFLRQLLYSCHGIPSSKYADSTSSCTQVYPCRRCPYLCSLISTQVLDLCILILCRYVAIYSSLACQIEFSFTQGKLCQLSKKYRLTSNVSLVYTYFQLARSVTLTFQTHSYIGGTMMIGLAWLDLLHIYSTYE